MHENAFGSWAPLAPAGELKCSPRPLATKGPTSKGRWKGKGRRGEGKGRKEREGKRRGGPCLQTFKNIKTFHRP